MPIQSSHDDPSVWEVDLVLNGYTVSTGEAAFGRIGTEYVMRNGSGARAAFPSTTERQSLVDTWRAFRRESPPGRSTSQVRPGEPRKLARSDRPGVRLQTTESLWGSKRERNLADGSGMH